MIDGLCIFNYLYTVSFFHLVLLRSQATEAKVISSTPNLQKALKRINIIKQRKVPLKLEELQQGVEIGSLEKTDIMQVSYKGQDPKLVVLKM